MTKTFENSGSEKEFLDMKEESKPYLSSEKTIPSWGNTPSVVASFRSKKISI